MVTEEAISAIKQQLYGMDEIKFEEKNRETIQQMFAKDVKSVPDAK